MLLSFTFIVSLTISREKLQSHFEIFWGVEIILFLFHILRHTETFVGLFFFYFGFLLLSGSYQLLLFYIFCDFSCFPGFQFDALNNFVKNAYFCSVFFYFLFLISILFAYKYFVYMLLLLGLWLKNLHMIFHLKT